MGWFGGREQALRERIQALEEEREVLVRELEQVRATKAEVERDRDRLRGDLESARRQASETGTALEKARASLSKAEQMVAWLDQKRAEAVAALEGANRGREEALEASTRAMREAQEARLEADRLRGELERLRLERQAEGRALQRPSPPPESSAPSVDGEERARWTAQLDDLKRRLAETQERLRVALRKAEHNRRAWLVTQSQLDLAEDRICLLTTGKPRPVLREERPGSGEAMASDEVEDEPEIDGPGGADSPEETPGAPG